MSVAPDAMLQEAVLLHRQGQLAEAVRRYEQILNDEPANPDALYYRAMVSCQQGQFAEGVEFAKKAVAARPASVRAHNLLGMALGRLGRNDEALGHFDQAIEADGNFAEAHGNRGNTLSDLGRVEEAVASYERAVKLAPDSIGDWINLGAAQHQLGRNEQALASFDRVLALQPDVPEALFNRGNVLTHLGRYPEAIASFDALLKLDPRNPDAHNNRGHAQIKLGRPEDALTSFDEALALAADHVGALVNRGIALKELGRLDDAIASYERALAIKSDAVDALLNLAAASIMKGDHVRALGFAVQALALDDSAEGRALFVQCVHNRRLAFDPGGLGALMIRALAEPWDRPTDLVIPAISLVKNAPAVKEACQRAAAAWPRRVAGDELSEKLPAIVDDLLLRTILENAPVCDIDLERLLTALRVILLAEAARGQPASGAYGASWLAFGCALARQCFINEYIFEATATERELAARLQRYLGQALRADGEVAPQLLAAVATYVPLHSISGIDALLDRPWPVPIALLLTQQVREPREEAALRATMPSLTPIADDVSLRVKQQYEENPYPRWVKAAPVRRVTLAEYLGGGIAVPEHAAGRTVEILIAGCGTGQNLVEIARQIEGANVTAIDLSLASLGYAKRQADALGLTNVTFATADILNIGSIGRSFDMIETGGVLHHLADPWAAWRTLLTLLRDGGLMRVALYSKSGRWAVNAARSLVGERGFEPTVEGIRQARQAILALDDQSPARTIVSYLDFFTVSECRDMLFHVQEHQMTLAEIADFIDGHGLEFVGLHVDPLTLLRFGERFPDAQAGRDLRLWQTYEAENPSAFTCMYQFWIRKKPSA
jgi:tetratricopeptide (TPR) repeat protein/SAM-dependent methyltransferase